MTTVAFPGHITLPELETQIRSAEDNDLKLVAVSADKNKLRTVCDFEGSGLPAGELLDPIILLNHGSPKPSNTVFLFSNNVVCENKEIVVDFYR